MPLVEFKGVPLVYVNLPPGFIVGCLPITPLNSTSGIMKGNYKMQLDDGEEFLAKIPSFSLDLPLDSKKPN